MQASRILPAGEMLGQRYRMIDQIGAGSTGVVYRASDLAFDREVAVKVMSHASGEATALFLREARTTAQLDHPSIVPIHDLVWLTGGGIAFAMKYIDGISLREALRRVDDGDPPRCLATINDTINVFLKLCDGIALAHDRGVIHCDIKPDNILVGQYGEVIILDWGEAASSGDIARDGSPVGTPAYMSPEQARGEPATPASDIWCIGATLFHCLIGRQPLVGKDLEPAAFWERKRHGAVDPRSRAESARCDRRLHAILDKALEPQPGRRYASVRALADDLASFQGGQSVSAYRESVGDRILRWYRRNIRVIWLSALLAASLVTLVAVIWGSHLQRMASWGRPVFTEEFAEGWQERWRIAAVGSFDVGGGRAISQLNGDGTMALRREWPPHCAIEFTGESIGGQEGDISVYWLEGSQVVDGSWAASRSGWGFLFGAWDNTCSTLEKVGGGPVACDRGTVVQAGRRHRIRAEVDGDRIQLIIDGRTIFDHRDSFNAGSGRWMIYTWGAGKAVSDISVYLRGSAELVSATSVPDALRQRGLANDAAAEYRLIAESKAGSALADQAWFKEGITWSEIGNWDRARGAWGRIRDPGLAEKASILALQPMMDAEPARLFDEIEARWPAAGASGRQALIQLWSASARIFSNTPLSLDDALVDRHFALRQRLFPESLEADPVVSLMARRTGRIRMAVDLVINPCLRAELLIKLGDLKRVEREGTSGTRLLAQRNMQTIPLVACEPVASSAPDWLTRSAGGEYQAMRARLLAADDMSGVTCLDRIFGDPRLTRDQPPFGLTLADCFWMHALEVGDAAEAGRWERAVAKRDADRESGGTWIQSMLEPVGIMAAMGRRDEARRFAEAMRAEPVTSWNGAATAWGAALCGAEVDVLPNIVHARQLVAAMRAELAGQPSATDLWRTWFALALPSHSIMPSSLLRLARWRSAPSAGIQR